MKNVCLILYLESLIVIYTILLTNVSNNKIQVTLDSEHSFDFEISSF